MEEQKEFKEENLKEEIRGIEMATKKSTKKKSVKKTSSSSSSAYKKGKKAISRLRRRNS